MTKGITETENMLLFWGGWPSQWHPARFEVDGIPYNCCEQYMMAGKARVFGDGDALRLILASDSPAKQKALGRKVRGFEADTWNSTCRAIVYQGNLARFSQNADSARVLLGTGDKLIVEASPVDPIWGIGLAQDDPRALDPDQWRGTNWLGVALMHVRQSLRSPGLSPEPVDPELAKQLARLQELTR